MSLSHLKERGAEERHGFLVQKAGAPLQQRLPLPHQQVPASRPINCFESQVHTLKYRSSLQEHHFMFLYQILDPIMVDLLSPLHPVFGGEGPPEVLQRLRPLALHLRAHRSVRRQGRDLREIQKRVKYH